MRNTWLQTRTAGVLAHISSLPGAHGIGNLGSSARRFVDFLARTGFRHWQICPLGPTSYGDSPYQSFSSFAGNPYFIDLQELVELGLLTADEVAPLSRLPVERVDYAGLYERFWDVLACAHRRFLGRGRPDLDGFGSFETFVREQSEWLRPYADFMALKARFGGLPWMQWPAEVRGWHEDLREALPQATREEAERQEFYQYLFFGQWWRLRDYAHRQGVSIIGDIPIFVALDSADTWHSRPIFRVDDNGQPTVVAGVPPDYYSESGQLWGNPLYDWDYLERTGFAWWIDRLRASFELFDIVRLDHFRGFDSYWEVPASAADARTGRWRRGPGMKFFDAVRRSLLRARIIAEDLGYITEDVFQLRLKAGLPGMKILQFAYGHDENNVNLPHFYPRESVVYTGTHDNNTIRGWLASLDAETLARVDDYFDLRG
ncbi:MAG: 4-alpha-glucanotransferase, partial [Verrucomicrobia bacterium]